MAHTMSLHRLTAAAPSDRATTLLLRIGAAALAVGLVAFGLLYYQDQHVAQVPSIMERQIALTAQEFVVLETLMRQAGRAMSRDELLDRAWPFGAELTQNAVEAYIHRLREKLGHAGERIETVRGIGYRLRDR